MRLSQWLQKSGLPAAALAQKLGKNPSYISNLCNPASPMQCSLKVGVLIEGITRGEVTCAELLKNGFGGWAVPGPVVKIVHMGGVVDVAPEGIVDVGCIRDMDMDCGGEEENP